MVEEQTACIRIAMRANTSMGRAEDTDDKGDEENLKTSGMTLTT